MTSESHLVIARLLWWFHLTRVWAMVSPLRLSEERRGVEQGCHWLYLYGDSSCQQLISLLYLGGEGQCLWVGNILGVGFHEGECNNRSSELIMTVTKYSIWLQGWSSKGIRYPGFMLTTCDMVLDVLQHAHHMKIMCRKWLNMQHVWMAEGKW